MWRTSSPYPAQGAGMPRTTLRLQAPPGSVWTSSPRPCAGSRQVPHHTEAAGTSRSLWEGQPCSHLGFAP